MIIELERYNKVRELLKGNRTTGSPAQVSYLDGDQRVSVTGAAVCMEEEGLGMRIGHRNGYNWVPSRQ